MNENLTDTLWRALPDVESVLIAALCLGSLVIVLDGIGVDVIANLQASDLSDVAIFSGVSVFISTIVERARSSRE